MSSRLPTLFGRAVAWMHPRRAAVDQRELSAFIASALTDAWTAGRTRTVAALLMDLSRDLARAWIGRSALPITARRIATSAHASRRSSPMDRLASDLRYAVRVLLRTPLFTTVAIVVLAIGIGTSTAVYAVVDGVLLRPYSYPDMGRIAILQERGGNGQTMSVAWPTYLDWRAQNDVFEELGVYRAATVTLTGGQEPERLTGSFLSSSVFASMGIPPIAGRVFGEAEDQVGTPRVAVISERLWRNRFGAREDIVGHGVTLNAEPFTIVGVMPMGMRFPSRMTDVWIPLGLFVSGFPASRGAHPGLTAVGRVKTGVTFDRARAGMDTVARRLGEQYPDTNKNLTVIVSSYYEQIVQNIRPTLYLLLGAVSLLLVMACTNLASLMLARAEGRHREFAVRAALGAARTRLVRQVLVEASLLAVVGGAAGVALAHALVQSFIAMRPTTIPRIDLLAVDWRVALFAVGLSAFTAIVVGLLPAIRAAAPDLQRHLRDVRSSGSRRAVNLRRVLVVGQVAVAAVLLVGAGLLGKSLARLSAIDLGFSPSQLLTMRLALPNAAYPTPDTWISFHRDVVDRLTALAGVDAVGVNSALPLEGGGAESPVIKEGDPPPAPGRVETMCLFQSTGGEYFRAMGIDLKRGRFFETRDMTGPPVAILDDTAAAKLFGAENPVGRRVAFEFEGAEGSHTAGPMVPKWREVVGVVGTVKHYALLGGPPYVQIYAPYTQLPIWFRDRRPAMAVVLRTTGDPDSMIASVRRTVASVDPRVPVYGVQPMTEYLGQQTEQPRLSALLMTGFGALAGLVAIIGLYGVLAYIVSQRTREIGVRLALGARRTDIVRQVVRSGLGLAVMGLVVGLGAAIGAMRWLTALLYQVSPTDGATFTWVAAGLLVTALVASLLPARRASRVDPLVALRSD
jgi:putative ABC transport system permease protein